MFVSCHTEDIDLYDIIWCAQQLRALGVGNNKIKIYTDHVLPLPHFKNVLENVFVGELDDIENIHKYDAETKHIVVIVAGHGGHEGLLTFNGKSFKPVPLLNIFKKSKSVETISVVLGQCYAGVFNYLNVRGEPKVCIIGATNLHQSIANPTTADFILENQQKVRFSWVANFFLIKFFIWLKNRTDVDGDGIVSILDGYRNAAILSNDELREIKKTNLQKIYELEAEKEQLGLMATAPSTPIRITAIEEQIEVLKSTINHHQEPWVLHADLARNIVVKL